MHGCRVRYLPVIGVLFAIMFISNACSPVRFLEEDEYLLDKSQVQADDHRLSTSTLSNYIHQHPNAKWFSLFKVPLGIYCLSGTDSTRSINRFIQRLGEPPVVYDSLLADRGRADMQAAVRNLGFLNSKVSLQEERHKQRVRLTYDIKAGDCYYVSKLYWSIDDPALLEILQQDKENSLLYVGMPFDVNILDQERSRLSSLFQDHGYYHFNKSLIRFEADKTLENHQVALTLHIPLYRSSSADTLENHRKYYIGEVNYLTNMDSRSFHEDHSHLDSLVIPPFRFYQHKSMALSPNFLMNKTDLRPGGLYRETDVHSTYNNLASLSAVLGANVVMEPSSKSSDTLNAYINILPAKKHGVSAKLEGTNSAGDFGAALSVGYQNRNLFRRSAMLSLELRGAFEAIKGLEGYTDQNYIEYNAEATFNFPEFMFPFLSRSFKRSVKAQSIVSVMFDSQNRPEFHRRVLTTAWRYRWNHFDLKQQHRVDLIDLNYVFMPWISETFSREYLSDNTSRNAILQYNYNDLFIMKWGYQFQYTSIPTTSQTISYGQNAYSIRVGIETAGNLLYGLSHLFNMPYSDAYGAYTLLNIAYAQYVKADLDFSKSFRIDYRNSMAMHFGFGVAYPFGNSYVLPYEKSYFSGGANSVRGWSVRGLGPGRFTGSDGRIDFLRQTGDMKLDASIEWRTHLFWKIDAAAFVDAGNIWTLRDYESQPGGQFRFDTFWNQIAVAYGLGIRLNFGYFILRLDGGMKALNPAYESGPEHYPIIHPDFSRDFQLHFAVGLPY